jgi:uncharacterized membrane protein YfcA
MTSHTYRGPAVRRALGYSLGLVLLWVILAVSRPTITFHLAPVFVAVSFPGVYRWQGGESRRVAWWLVLVGAAVGLISTALLAGGGYLDGPSLLPVGGAALESLVGVTVGTVLAMATVAWRSVPEA